MASLVDQTFWLEFFELFKNHPEIWKIKSEQYKNRALRQKAYALLLTKYKELKVNATEDTLKKRISNIRTCYRRELKKIDKSTKSGCGTDDIYKPTLWYFYHLDFLKDQEEQIHGVSSLDMEEDSFPDLDESASSKANKRKKINRNEILIKAVEHLEKQNIEPSKDEADFHAASWAAFYRKLESKQQLYASKTISEVLFQASLGNLNDQSHKFFELNYGVDDEFLTNNSRSSINTSKHQNLTTVRPLSSNSLHTSSSSLTSYRNSPEPSNNTQSPFHNPTSVRPLSSNSLHTSSSSLTSYRNSPEPSNNTQSPFHNPTSVRPLSSNSLHTSSSSLTSYRNSPEPSNNTQSPFHNPTSVRSLSSNSLYTSPSLISYSNSPERLNNTQSPFYNTCPDTPTGVQHYPTFINIQKHSTPKTFHIQPYIPNTENHSINNLQEGYQKSYEQSFTHNKENIDNKINSLQKGNQLYQQSFIDHQRNNSKTYKSVRHLMQDPEFS